MHPPRRRRTDFSSKGLVSCQLETYQTYVFDNQSMMAQSYKTLKEDFVSNLAGGKISEINYVTAVAPVCTIVYLSTTLTVAIIGCSSLVVCTSVTSWVFHRLWPGRIPCGFPSQRWRHTPRNDLLLFCSGSPQCPPCLARAAPLSCSISDKTTKGVVQVKADHKIATRAW